MYGEVNTDLLELPRLLKSTLLPGYATHTKSSEEIGADGTPATMRGIGNPIRCQAREFREVTKHLSLGDVRARQKESVMNGVVRQNLRIESRVVAATRAVKQAIFKVLVDM